MRVVFEEACRVLFPPLSPTCSFETSPQFANTLPGPSFSGVPAGEMPQPPTPHEGTVSSRISIWKRGHRLRSFELAKGLAGVQMSHGPGI